MRPDHVDGTSGIPAIRIRAVHGSDAEDIQQFIAALSEQTSYRRFLSPVHRLTSAQMAAVVQVDHRLAETLLAETLGDRGWSIIGMAQYVGIAPGTADIAVVVADRWQRQGVGTFLLQRLAELAGARGFGRLQGDYLSTNRAIVRLVQRLGGELDLVPDGAVSVMTAHLPARSGGRPQECRGGEGHSSWCGAGQTNALRAVLHDTSNTP